MPFLETYPHELKRAVADAGYGSVEILLTLDRMGIEHFIKYSLFDKEQKKKYKESDRNLDNWTYDETTDTYTHPESWVYQFDHLKHRHSTTGFRQENMVYKAEQADLAP